MFIKNNRIHNVILLAFVFAVSGLLVSCGSDSTGPNGMKCKDLPSNFASDIPIYKPSCAITVFTHDVAGTAVNFVSKSSSSAIANFYEKKLSNWDNYKKLSYDYGSGTVFHAEKGSLIVGVTIVSNRSGFKENVNFAFRITYNRQ